MDRNGSHAKSCIGGVEEDSGSKGAWKGLRGCHDGRQCFHDCLCVSLDLFLFFHHIYEMSCIWDEFTMLRPSFRTPRTST